MKNNLIIDAYLKQYAELRFERSGFFEIIEERFHSKEVLYPGSSIHITPAFFFPHVLFIDSNAPVQKFFANLKVVLDFVKRYRKYRQVPYIRFIAQDFTQPIPVRKSQFDLVLALYADGVAAACKSNIKVGGLLVTNNHQNDAINVAKDNEFDLIVVAQHRKGKYQLIEDDPGQFLVVERRSDRGKRYLRQTSSGVEYIEKETYFVFRKVRRKPWC